MILKQLSLGDRMKFYEKNFSCPVMIPLLPICARIDGRSFHSWTKGLKRPYDERLTGLFKATTKYLIKETDANIGYTQSDEITLIWKNDSLTSEAFFGGRRDKLVSVIASATTAYFNFNVKELIPEKEFALATFDCRVFQVPNLTEAVNLLVWREQDATRNSIQMAVQDFYSHDELQNKNCNQLQELMFQKGVNWNDYPTFFKRGTYIKRVKVLRTFTPNELNRLPINHQARINPDLEFERTDIVDLDLPPITSLDDKIGYLFNNKTESIHGTI